jgi:hypothetical protein
MRPEYQFGPEDSMTSEIAAAEQVPLTQPPALDDSLFSDDNQSQDIKATLSDEPQHTDDVLHQRAAILQQNSLTADDSMQENTPRLDQATPVDQDTQDQNHEL